MYVSSYMLAPNWKIHFCVRYCQDTDLLYNKIFKENQYIDGKTWVCKVFQVS